MQNANFSSAHDRALFEFLDYDAPYDRQGRGNDIGDKDD
jgi:hypothetical protein